MSVTWDSAHFAPDERADALRETIRDVVVRVDLDLPPSDQVRARVSLSELSRVQLCSVDAMPTAVTRTSSSARCDHEEPALFLTLQVSGTSAMVQGEKYAVLLPGQFAVYSTTKPYSLLFDEGVKAHFFRIPLPELALPDEVIRDASTRPMGSADDPAGRLTASYLHQLATDTGLRAPAVSDALGSPTVELLRATLASATGRRLSSREVGQGLDHRIRHYLRQHLAEPGLCAAQVAMAHHISVRHLYGILQRAGIHLGDWIRSERLEQCRRELARPENLERTIASIAHGWGFSDPAHFSRAFRAAYGLSPRDWREAKVRPPEA